MNQSHRQGVEQGMTVGGSAEIRTTVAFITMVGGLIGALGAAIPGAIDLLYYKGGAPPVKKVALTHMAPISSQSFSTR